ncbi:MAG: EthD family reductase [Beijerinckiaceae bacterium]
MAKLLAMYRHPKDKEAFDAYYFSTHAPLAKKIPKLRAYDVSSGGVSTPGGPAPFHLIATLTFDSAADIAAAFATPEGKATAADLANFADGGVELMFFDVKEV